MKNSEIIQSLSFALLRFVRDEKPTQAALLEWLGDSQTGRFHSLRKVGILELENEIVRLSPAHLSEDGRQFLWENLRFHLDEGKVDVICRSRPAK